MLRFMPEKLSEEQVRHVARLSRLSLRDEEVRDFAHQLSAVLDYFSMLSRLDVSNVEPMAHASDVKNVLREDTPDATMEVEAVLANAPQTSPPFFRVVKVLSDGTGA